MNVIKRNKLTGIQRFELTTWIKDNIETISTLTDSECSTRYKEYSGIDIINANNIASVRRMLGITKSNTKEKNKSQDDVLNLIADMQTLRNRLIRIEVHLGMI